MPPYRGMGQRLLTAHSYCMPTIKYYGKHVWGQLTWYIADPEQATLIARLTGKRTVSLADLNALAGLGMKIEEVPMPTVDGHTCRTC